jgi:hypothetical protein
MSTLVQGNTYYTNNYICGNCGQRVTTGTTHTCPHIPGTTGHQTMGYQCFRCGLWVFGGTHVCITGASIGYDLPVSAPSCRHCYCIDVPPTGKRTKPHHECCRCGDVRVKE